MTVADSLEERLRTAFQPTHLSVENESHQHNVPPGSESHFRVVIVSDAFAGRRAVARHQAVYGCLAAELRGPVHALALHTYTPQEWQEAGIAPQSPDCLGGGARAGSTA